MTEAAELIERLRRRARQLDKAGDGLGYYSRADSMIEREAADHIETLEARVATLSAAAQSVLDRHDDVKFKELPAGGTYSSVPERELNALDAAIAQLRAAREASR